MSTDLQTDGIARVWVNVDPDSPTGWSLSLRVFTPTTVELQPASFERVGDDFRALFNVGRSLLGRTYELVVNEADGDRRVIESGFVTEGSGVLQLELPQDSDTPTITVSDTAPEDPEEGDLWLQPSPTFFVGASEPTDAVVGDIWFDTSTT